MIAKVALPFALNKEFDYRITDRSQKIGMRVLVDFKGRKRVGIITELRRKSPIKKIKEIIASLDNFPLLNNKHIVFASKLSKNSFYSRGEFIFMMLPPYLRRLKKDAQMPATIYKKTDIKYGQRPSLPLFIRHSDFLRRCQQYRTSIKKAISSGSILIIFPQVSQLKPAAEIIFKDLKCNMVFLHSQMSPKEIYKNWLRSRLRSVILGTRSALFYYPSDTKLIVIEEENSPYYFQEEKPYYHLQDAARILSTLLGAELFFSADFPTLSSYFLIKKEKILLKDLPEFKRPKINILEFGVRKSVVNPLLLELIRKNIVCGRSVVLFYNRKGFSRYLYCSRCGYKLICQNCQSPLASVSYQNKIKGICFRCGKEYSYENICPSCQEGYIKSKGLGIQKLMLIIKKNFPEFKLNYWQDAPEGNFLLGSRKNLSSLYYERKFDCGFILDIDKMFNLNDYNCGLMAFFYIMKASHCLKDDLYIFTHNPKYYIFEGIKDNNWQIIYEKEIELRQKLYLPPSAKLLKIVIRQKKEPYFLKNGKEADKRGDLLYNKINKIEGVLVYGPFPDYPPKRGGYYRYFYLIKIKSQSSFKKLHSEVIKLRSYYKRSAFILDR